MKSSLTVILTILWSTVFSQYNAYEYTQEMTNVSEQWHKVVLPNSIFSDVSNNLSDIRIIGITVKNDTLEVPYILKTLEEKVERKKISFKRLNQTGNTNGHYFTFEIPTEELLNRITLDFKEKNFDWKIQLEGSQNQQEWFGIIDNYRIVSIKNDLTDYKFTTLKFPTIKYRYLRIRINSDKKPTLKSVSIIADSTIEGRYKSYSVSSFKATEDEKKNQTEVIADLEFVAPVYEINIEMEDTIDFYRPITIQYLEDSVKYGDTWKYKYRTLKTGTLSSLESNSFRFFSTIIGNIRVLIHNGDNEPLTVKSISAKGHIHELIGRFPKADSYHLLYGNKNAHFPNYDISHFSDQIPENAIELKLGPIKRKPKKEVVKRKPLFENEFWLWGTMGVIVLLLGWFSFRMMKEK